MEKKYSYRNSKVVVLEEDGICIGWYDCISDVARMLGVSTTTVTKRIDRLAVIDGRFFRFRKEWEDLTSMPCLSPLKKRGKTPRPKSGVMVNGFGDVVKVERTRKERVSFDRAKDFDRNKCSIVHYELSLGCRCITPCPFMQSPKILVGSVNCEKCSSFRGKDRSTHEVACSRKY